MALTKVKGSVWDSADNGLAVSVKDFGVVGDGSTDDTAAMLLADAASSNLLVPEGCALTLKSNIDIDANLYFTGGTMHCEGNVINLNGFITSNPVTVFTFGAGVTFKLTQPQDIYADWFDVSQPTGLPRAFKFSAAGSKIRLLGKTYISDPINWNVDPLNPDSDIGKVIEGTVLAQRYKTTGEFYGTRIILSDNANTDFIYVDGNSANLYSSGGIINVFIDGNSANQTSGSGIKIGDVFDFYLENIYVFQAKEHGIEFAGNNSQTHLEGVIEVWNCGGSGIWGGALGDIQSGAAIRCVNNAGYGFYMAAGQGRFDQIYTYFNTERGVWFGPSVLQHVYVGYLRSEDNDKEGVRIDAKNIHIVHADLPDNGATTATASEQTGLVLSSAAENIKIGTLVIPDRSASAVPHNQRFAVYDLGCISCNIDQMMDYGYSTSVVASKQSVLHTVNNSLKGLHIQNKMLINDTYANLKDAGATVTPLPDVYSDYIIQDISASMTVNNTSASRSGEKSTLSFEISSTGSFNVFFGTDYLDNSGGALGATALTAGQSLTAVFKRQKGKWYLQQAIRVA